MPQTVQTYPSSTIVATLQLLRVRRQKYTVFQFAMVHHTFIAHFLMQSYFPGPVMSLKSVEGVRLNQTVGSSVNRVCRAKATISRHFHWTCESRKVGLSTTQPMNSGLESTSLLGQAVASPYARVNQGRSLLIGSLYGISVVPSQLVTNAQSADAAHHSPLLRPSSSSRPTMNSRRLCLENLLSVPCKWNGD